MGAFWKWFFDFFYLTIGPAGETAGAAAHED